MPRGPRLHEGNSGGKPSAEGPPDGAPPPSFWGGGALLAGGPFMALIIEIPRNPLLHRHCFCIKAAAAAAAAGTVPFVHCLLYGGWWGVETPQVYRQLYFVTP